MTSTRIIGPGRAGGALALALSRCGWDVAAPLGRHDPVESAASGVDMLVIATPDSAIAGVAQSVRPVASTVVVHLAGSLGLEVLEPHPRRAALHPLVSLPDAQLGAQRLRGAWFGVAGDPLVDHVVAELGGRSFTVTDGDRAVYHAAACVAANHVVALLGQVERLTATAGVPFEPFLALARGALDNVAALGPAKALTGPAARGDDATIAAHLEALPDTERGAYTAMVAEARRLAGKEAE